MVRNSSDCLSALSEPAESMEGPIESTEHNSSDGALIKLSESNLNTHTSSTTGSHTSRNPTPCDVNEDDDTDSNSSVDEVKRQPRFSTPGEEGTIKALADINDTPPRRQHTDPAATGQRSRFHSPSRNTRTSNSTGIHNNVNTPPFRKKTALMPLLPGNDDDNQHGSDSSAIQGEARQLSSSSKAAGRLADALHKLQQVDLILEQLALFWANTEVVLEVLTKKGQHVEQFIGFASKPRLLARFKERLEEYKRFWEGVQLMCANYTNGVQASASSAMSPATQMNAHQAHQQPHSQGSHYPTGQTPPAPQEVMQLLSSSFSPGTSFFGSPTIDLQQGA